MKVLIEGKDRVGILELEYFGGGAATTEYHVFTLGQVGVGGCGQSEHIAQEVETAGKVPNTDVVSFRLPLGILARVLFLFLTASPHSCLCQGPRVDELHELPWAVRSS